MLKHIKYVNFVVKTEIRECFKRGFSYEKFIIVIYRNASCLFTIYVEGLHKLLNTLNNCSM